MHTISFSTFVSPLRNELNYTLLPEDIMRYAKMISLFSHHFFERAPVSWAEFHVFDQPALALDRFWLAEALLVLALILEFDSPGVLAARLSALLVAAQALEFDLLVQVAARSAVLPVMVQSSGFDFLAATDAQSAALPMVAHNPESDSLSLVVVQSVALLVKDQAWAVDLPEVADDLFDALQAMNRTLEFDRP
jgi:hypothetical protein